MYLQIRQFHVKTGSAEQLCKQAADQFLPLVKGVKGFVDYMIIDNQDGNVMSISICEDQAGVEQTYQLAKDWHRQFSQQLEGPQQVIQGEVMVDSSGFLKQSQTKMAA